MISFSSYRHFRLALAGTLLGLALCTPAFADQAQLRRQLESSYKAYRQATITKDFGAWQAATSPYRIAATRNLITSQKLVWPHAIFDIPVVPPALAQLTFLTADEKGPTAQLAYIGPVDFGVVEGKIPENVLIIKFHKNGTRWQYDRTQFVNLVANPDIGALAKRRDTSFLQGPRYEITGNIPPIPKPCPKPDYIGHLNIISYGYKTTIFINGERHRTIAYNTVSTDVVIGGLNPGENPISIITEPVGDGPPESREFAVSVFATHDLNERTPVRIFNYVPPQAPPSIRSSVWVTPNTLQGR